jgi:glutamyl-tRNA synthetase
VKVKTRFCPSPTGYIHMGNMRTALFNILFAHAKAGTFLLRIEDTDKARSDHKYVSALMQDLRWLGMQWDEGPDVSANSDGYYQSQRQPIYDQYYDDLVHSGRAYPCFCSEAELKITRRLQLAAGRPPRYPGTCAQLTAAQVETKKQTGLVPVLRFRVPVGEIVTFEDHVRGQQNFPSEEIGDFIIRRTDGTSPFMFCNAIDDALMGVTHVMRGEDHLTNTPRQVMILEALKLPVPSYAHISMIVGNDGTPLSKRHGSWGIQQMREKGYLPIAVINYLARLGHNFEDNRLLPLAELAQQFKLESLGKSPAHFDAAQLLHWQKEAINQLSLEQTSEWLADVLKTGVPKDKLEAFVATIQANLEMPDDALIWVKALHEEPLELSDEHAGIIKTAGAGFFAAAADYVQNNGANYSALVKELQTKLNVKGKGLFQPLRAALTGQLHGPEMEKILNYLGAEKVVARLRAAEVVSKE